MMRNEYIYIVLVKAHTGLGKVSRVLSGGYEYSHIAVCRDDRFEDFITFSRRRHYAPFDAGFMHETRSCYCFGVHDRIKLKIFRLPVDLRARRKIDHFLKQVERQQDRYLFNLYSMVTMPFLHGAGQSALQDPIIGMISVISTCCWHHTCTQSGIFPAGIPGRRQDIWTKSR